MRTYIIRSAVSREARVFAERAAVGDRSGARSFFFHTPFGPSTQKLRTFSHTKIIIRSTCAHCARKKRAAVCIFQPFKGVFFFLLYALCANRPRVFCSLRATAALQSLHPRTSCVDDPRFRGHRALFLHGEQAAALSFAPRWDEPMHNNGQTADGHTGCRSAVWPLLDRDRRAVAAHCGGRHRHRATARGGA